MSEMSMTTDHMEIRNSADDDGPVFQHNTVYQSQKVLHEQLEKVFASNNALNQMFAESQDVARTAVAEVKRLRKFIADEFLLDVS